MIRVPLSSIGSLVAAEVLAGRVRIHWTLGLGSNEGPRFGPRRVFPGLSPMGVGATVLGAHWGAGTYRHSGIVALALSLSTHTVLGPLSVLFARRPGRFRAK